MLIPIALGHHNHQPAKQSSIKDRVTGSAAQPDLVVKH